MKQKTVLLLTAALLLTIFVTASLLYKRNQAEAAIRLAAQHSAHLVRPHSPRLGAENTPALIVEFFDPACGTCQAFYLPLKHLLQDHPGKIGLVMRWAPFQVGSEHIVALLEAARRQDKFWPVLDVLMETQDEWKPQHEAELELALQQIAGLGLDLDQLRQDMADPEIARRINQDQEDAAQLKVDTTPTYYVNGKPLPAFGFKVLKQTVESILRGG
ncbi:MAG: thioredoxin domain-containing protein [Pseudomonadota bacterium]